MVEAVRRKLWDQPSSGRWAGPVKRRGGGPSKVVERLSKAKSILPIFLDDKLYEQYLGK